MRVREIAIADRRALGATLERNRNSALCEAILQGAPLEVYATADGSVLAIDRDGVGRLSDPATPDAARAFAGAVRERRVVLARGPVDAAAAFVAEHGAWAKIFDGVEMAWLAAPELRAVAGELRCSTELERSFEDWRAAFIAEAFRDGGTPPAVAPEQLFVWATAQPHAMAGLLAQGPTGARIVTVYTPPSERGQGYAAALTAALGERARREGRSVTLDVAVDDPWARRAYERAGFRAVGFGSTYRRIS